MELKDTLFLPDTAFPMKASLPVLEKSMHQAWTAYKIWDKLKSQNVKGKKFLLVDGPPYANGQIHIGHALNKILKDISVRYHFMIGDNVDFDMAWDTHGLPIEVAVLKELKAKNFAEFKTEYIHKVCGEFALKQIEIQKNQFERLGLLKSNKIIKTLDQEYVLKQIKIFFHLVKNNLVYRSAKPIFWSWSSGSALAESEIEYQDKQSLSLYVGFKLADGQHKDAMLIAWTTTPWTLVANEALAINSNYEYGTYELEGKKIIIANSLSESYFSLINKKAKLLNSFSGKELESVSYHGLFDHLKLSKIFHADFVEDTTGTGIVHIAPAHGIDDFTLGKKHKLKITLAINDKGVIVGENPFVGVFYETANEQIKNYLNEKDSLFGEQLYNHSYPHDWRTKKPVVVTCVPQWFINLEKVKNELSTVFKDTHIQPKWGIDQLKNMLLTRQEWCISRQRKWGVVIPLVFNKKTNEIIFNNEIENNILNIFEKKGPEVWEQLSIKEIVGSEHEDYEKVLDIMDVWFDSGTLFDQYENQADLYIEGTDQFRGWFNSSSILSYLYKKQAPAKNIVAHGFVCDEKGNKMSKSVGNVVDPLKVSEEHGAEILRLWVTSTNFQTDVKIGLNTLSQIGNSYRKIRNTIRFMLANLNDFETTKHVKLSEIDEYMIIRTNLLINEVSKNYNSLNLEKVFMLINDFVVNELSGFYLDFIKDIIYVEHKSNVRKTQILFTVDFICKSLIVLLAPIMPHTSEEAWLVYSKQSKLTHSVFQQRINELPINNIKVDSGKWDLIWNLKNEVYKALENARFNKVIGKSLEAELMIDLNDEYKKYFADEKLLEELFMVSKVTFIKLEKGEFKTANIEVKKHNGQKCNRCWKYFDNIKNDLCERCEKVIHEHFS